MATTEGRLNQANYAALDAAQNDYLFIRLDYSVPVRIKHINYGVSLLSAAERLIWGWMSFQVLRNAEPDSTMDLGNYKPATGKSVLFFDSLQGDLTKDIDFSIPLEIKAGEKALIILTPPTGLVGGGGLGVQAVYLTVSADFGEAEGRTVRPKPFGG